jgi:hypothetical protein
MVSGTSQISNLVHKEVNIRKTTPVQKLAVAPKLSSTP